MAKTTRIKDDKHPYAYQYECVCGKEMELFQHEPVKKLVKCWECLGKGE